jgi:predicted O-methyltransferase YrrM
MKSLTTGRIADLVEIRVGDALETLKGGIGDQIDLVHLDGAFHLYLPVLKLLEPHLKSSALIIAENAIEPGYLEYVRNPAKGYLSLALPFGPARGNEFTIFTG